jgi:hypothetical protein
LDPAHLREVFKKRVKKLVAVKKFFTATTLYVFEAQQEVVKKRFTQSRRNAGDRYLEKKSSHGMDEKSPRQPRRSILSSPESSRNKRGPSLSWVSDDNLHEVHIIDKVYDGDIRRLCFYTIEEIKLFRFEKVRDIDQEEIIEE